MPLFKKIRNKNDWPFVCVVSFTFRSLLEPFQFITYFVYAGCPPSPGHSQGQVQSFGLGGGVFFKTVLSRGRGRGKSKLASPCFCEVRHSSRGWHDGGGPRDCLFSRENVGIFRKVVGPELWTWNNMKSVLHVALRAKETRVRKNNRRLKKLSHLILFAGRSFKEEVKSFFFVFFSNVVFMFRKRV